MTRPGRHEPQPLGRALEDLVARRSWKRRLEGTRIFDVWEDVAGPSIAGHADPVRLHGGVLVVAAEDAAWATQLRYLVSDLQRRANEQLGPETVKQVQIVVGRGGQPD